MNLSKIIIKSMELVEKYLYDSVVKKDRVLKMVRDEIGPAEYDKLESVVIDILEMLIQISKKKIKLHLNESKWSCIS